MSSNQSSTSPAKAKKITTSPTWVKYTQWEFWPMWLATIPHIFMWIWFSIRSRAIFWMTPANPSIITGGLTGEPKNEIYDLMPEDLLPRTVYIENPDLEFEKVLEKAQAAGIQYPLICKPNRGERGTKVAKIDDEEAFRNYTKSIKVDYLIQDYIDFPNEAAVMVYIMPDSQEQGILSVTDKVFLHVVGDGQSTLLELMEANLRAVMVLDTLKIRFKDRLQEILPKGTVLKLEPIGNHCRGTGFYDGSKFITEAMVQRFADITRNIKGVYFARYDLKYDTVEDLQAGRVKILELNGVGADPAHIYDPKLSIGQKYGVIYRQFKTIFRIARKNYKKGVPYMSLKEWRKHQQFVKEYNQKLLS